jgi:hypothetical protein
VASARVVVHPAHAQEVRIPMAITLIRQRGKFSSYVSAPDDETAIHEAIESFREEGSGTAEAVDRVAQRLGPFRIIRGGKNENE